MIHVYIVSEGLTEVNFVRELVHPHVESVRKNELAITPTNLKGHNTYARLAKEVRLLLRSREREVQVSTMVDLYRLPSDFPGFAAAKAEEDPLRRVEALESNFADDIADSRFVPYLQLYEFEALLLADTLKLAEYYPARKREIADLSAAVSKGFQTPEHVDHLHPPSRRIKHAIPEYQKPIAGVITALAIGLDRIRSRCPHFSSWVRKLENLSLPL